LELNEVIQLLPNEHYLQITNLDNGIDFDGDYQAFLVDSNDNTKANITTNVSIFEFVDNNGINQIAIELYKLGLDFYKQPLFLKLVHTTSNDVYYSNSFYLTNYEAHKTVRFDYRNNSEFFGIAYNKVDFFQSIRLQTWFAALKNETEIGNYYQISTGNTISNRPLFKQKELYKSDYMNNFCFERLNSVLLSDIIYLDGVRVTNKTVLKDGEFIGDTNYFKTEFEVFKDYSQRYLPYPFIREPLTLVSFSPSGVYTLGSIPISGNAYFNYPVVTYGSFKLYNYDTDALVQDISIFPMANFFIFDMPILPNGNYYFTLENATSSAGDTLSILDKDIWNFSIQDGEYESLEYDNTEYLIN
jgi:hypothetical protein